MLNRAEEAVLTDDLAMSLGLVARDHESAGKTEPTSSLVQEQIQQTLKEIAKASPSPPADNDDDTAKLGLIIGGVTVGALVLMVTAGVMYKFWYQRSRANGHTRLV